MLHQSAELLELTLNTNVVQVTNVAPATTLEQMQTLFGFLGKIEEIKLYPIEDCPLQPSSKVCYVKYVDKTSVGVAQHLTNTVFIDRALIVVPVADVADESVHSGSSSFTIQDSGDFGTGNSSLCLMGCNYNYASDIEGIIPDEAKAMAIISPSTNMSGLMNSNQSQVVNQVVSGVGGTQVITTIDPHLTALGLPQYPPLPANMDPSKVEEIRRTIYVGNLDSTITAEQLLKFFNQIGEVKYVRMAGDETQPTRFAFVEFTEQSSLANALQYNGVIFYNRPLKINHSNNAIVKPQAKSSEAAQREIEEAMKRVREAQSLITAAIEPELAEKEKKRDRSRSRSRSHSRIRSLSRSRRRSRSPSHSHHRSRSGKRSRSRSHHRSPGHRSHSRKRSSSPRHRSLSKVHRSRSRDRHSSKKRSSSPRNVHRRSRSKSKDRVKKRSRTRSRSKSPSKKRSSRSSKTKSSGRSDASKEKERSPKEEKKKDPIEIKSKEDIDERQEQNNLTKDNEENMVTETPVEVVQENKLFSQNQDIDLRIETGEFNICTDLPAPLTVEVAKENQSDDQDVNESLKKESEEKLKKRARSRTPSKYASPTKSPKYRSSRSPSRKKSSHSPSRHKRSPSRRKASRSPSRCKSSRSPSRHKSSRSPSSKKSSRSPSRSKLSRSPGRHRHSRSPSHSLKRRSRSPKRSRSKRSPVSRHRSRSPSYRSSRSPGHHRRRSSRSPSRWSRSPRRRSRSRSRSIRRDSKHKRKGDSGHDRERRKRKDDSKESKVKRDYDEEEKGFDSSPNRHGPKLPASNKKKPDYSSAKIESKNSDSEGTDHKPGDMDLDSD